MKSLVLKAQKFKGENRSHIKQNKKGRGDSIGFKKKNILTFFYKLV